MTEDEQAPGQLAALLPGLPDAHAKAVTDSAHHAPLFRLRLSFQSTSPTEGIFFQDDGHRAFDATHTLKLVQSGMHPHLIHVRVTDLGCTLTTLDGITVDGARLESSASATKPSVTIEDHHHGSCPVFNGCCTLPPSATVSPTPKGQRDTMLLAVHFQHGLKATKADFQLQASAHDARRRLHHVLLSRCWRHAAASVHSDAFSFCFSLSHPPQVKWYSDTPGRVRKAHNGSRLAAIECRYDASKTEALRWSFIEEPSSE